MLPKISLKKLMFLSLGLLIIGALTNCGGSGGGSGAAAPAATKPVKPKCTAGQFLVEGACESSIVFDEPAALASASSCEGDLALEVTINNQKECFNADEQAMDFVLASTAEGSERSWPNTDVMVALAVKDATLAVQNCAAVNEVVKDAPSSFKADFSSHFSCEFLARSTIAAKEATYKINIVHGISEAADFKSDFFANAAARFVLTKNIDLAAETGSFAPSFKGQLDGANHEINGFSIDAGTTNDIGLISEIVLSAEDSTVEIKDLTLGITRLVGQDYVGGLIGWVGSYEGARAVQINDVTVEFAKDAVLQCNARCGGLVGLALSKVHFSGIAVKGEVSASGDYLGGVVGIANAMELSSVKSHFDMKYSDGHSIGLVAGLADQNSTLSKIDASGAITCEGTCNFTGGVVGELSQSQLSQAKSSLQLKTSSNSQSVGGVVGRSIASTLTAVYGKLTAEVGNATNFGSIAGEMSGIALIGSIKRAVGYLDATSNGTLITSGSLVGRVGSGANIQQVFAAGSMNAGNLSGNAGLGQMIGSIWFESLTAENCYSGAFTGNSIPAEAVGDINVSVFDSASDFASFTKCYTRADKFVADDDVFKVIFNTVYATTPQTDSLGVTSETLPDTFDLSLLNGSDGTLWTKTYGVTEYTYPMLAYPKEDMEGGPISEADWFEFQIIDNEKK